MNKRLCNMLTSIITKENKSVSDISKRYNISEKTIRADLKKINATLKSMNLSKIDIHQNGDIQIDKSHNINIIDIILKRSNYYNYKLSQDERKTILAMIILNQDNYITISKLSELLFVSKNTLLSDIDYLKDWFEENNMNLNSRTRRGYIIIGSEKEKRQGMIKLLMLNGYIFEQNYNYENNIFKNLLVQEFDENSILERVEEIIQRVENKTDIYLTDYSFIEVVYYLTIVINRIIKGESIQEYIDIQDNKKNSVSNMSFEIINNIKEEFGLEIPDKEVYLLTQELKSKSYIRNNGENIDTIDIQILINEFIYKISQHFSINYYLDFYLYDLLANHIKGAINRLKNNHTINNPLKHQIEVSYPEVFVAVKQEIKYLEKYINKKFTSDEISYIVTYIVSILERYKVVQVKINTIIVCNTGRGTAELIKTKLNNAFLDIKIIDIISSRQINYMEKEDVDLIISTVPLDNSIYNTVQVNPIMQEDDLYKIQKQIIEIKEMKIRKQEFSNQNNLNNNIKNLSSIEESKIKFINIIDEESITLDEEASDWEEAIWSAGEILYNIGKIEKKYITSMIENVHEHGPYIVIYPGVAIAHANPEDGCKKVGASILRLKNPVKFNHELNDPVKYIIALSLTDTDDIKLPLYNLTKMLGTKTFLEELDKSNTPSDILQSIEHHENRVV